MSEERYIHRVFDMRTLPFGGHPLTEGLDLETHDFGITPEMIEAGVEELKANYLDVLFPSSDAEYKSLVAAIFSEMLRVHCKAHAVNKRIR